MDNVVPLRIAIAKLANKQMELMSLFRRKSQESVTTSIVRTVWKSLDVIRQQTFGGFLVGVQDGISRVVVEFGLAAHLIGAAADKSIGVEKRHDGSRSKRFARTRLTGQTILHNFLMSVSELGKKIGVKSTVDGEILRVKVIFGFFNVL